MTGVRTIQRGYHAGGRQPAGQVRRVHVVREDGPRGWAPGSQAMCGVAAWNCTSSPPLIRDAPHELPDGLSWCPKCIGLLAERQGLLNAVAALIGASPQAAN